MTMTLPLVQSCSATTCGYNHDGCHAFAITVRAEDSACGTFAPLTPKGGMDTGTAVIGACTRTDCAHNSELECSADSVVVGPGPDGSAANCATYLAA
ncbi:MAG: DUF1540 domain-containing protein [Propioniciclava sp.]